MPPCAMFRWGLLTPKEQVRSDASAVDPKEVEKQKKEAERKAKWLEDQKDTRCKINHC